MSGDEAVTAEDRPKGPRPGSTKGGATRRAARLAAVQALYGMEVGERGVLETVADFEGHWFPLDREEGTKVPHDDAFFQDLVAGVVRHQASLDPIIHEGLKKGWPLGRLEAVLRAILRAGAYELAHRGDVDTPIVISEYVELTKAFHEGPEVGLVNGVLDLVARRVRGAGGEGEPPAAPPA